MLCSYNICYLNLNLESLVNSPWLLTIMEGITNNEYYTLATLCDTVKGGNVSHAIVKTLYYIYWLEETVL